MHKDIMKTILFLFFAVSSSFSYISPAPFDGFNLAMRAYLKEDYIKAGYYFLTCIKAVPYFHLNHKSFYYLSDCYRFLGNNDIAKSLLDSALKKDNEEITNLLKNNPLYFLQKGDSIQAIAILDSARNDPFLNVIKMHILKNSNLLTFLAYYSPPVFTNIPHKKVYYSWRNRFGKKDEIDIITIKNTEIYSILTDRSKSYLVYLINKNEDINYDNSVSTYVTTNMDLVSFFVAKAAYYKGLNDIGRMDYCLSCSRSILKWMFEKVSEKSIDSIFADQSHFCSRFNKKDWKYLISQKYINDVEILCKKYSNIRLPHFKDTEAQNLFESINAIANK
jgi:tetratricopeptide (TPR) repeat protein